MLNLISGLESISQLNLEVDQEVNLLEGITFENGTSFVKMQIEKDGQTTDIPDPQHFVPDTPGTCNIILVVKDFEGKTVEFKVENLTIKAVEYQAMVINYLQPKEILPIVGKINV